MTANGLEAAISEMTGKSELEREGKYTTELTRMQLSGSAEAEVSTKVKFIKLSTKQNLSAFVNKLPSPIAHAFDH